MQLTINGKTQHININQTEIFLNELIEILAIKQNFVLELNGEIIKKNEFLAIKVKENDNIEILYFMGGG